MEKISIIVPCYNEEEAIPLFYQEIKKVFKTINYRLELIMVDDGSTDKTLDVIKSLKDVKYLSFSRNFGKEAAMLAGLSHATGDYLAIMDVDLQDPPSLIPEMINYIQNDGYDIVATRRINRKKEGWFRSVLSKIFYRIINRMSKIEMVSGARDFRLMTRQVVNNILKMNEYNRYSKGLFSFVGFKTKWIEFENNPRSVGKTKWSLSKLFVYAIEGITSFSTSPLVMSAIIGLVFCFISFIMILVIIIKTLAFGDPTSGWPSMVCIIFFVSGIQLFCIGVMGEYLAKMYLEIKKRPIYIIREENIGVENEVLSKIQRNN